MSRFLKYLCAQFKRTLKIYPVVLAFTLILSGSLALLLSNMLSENEENEAESMIKIGVVGDLDGTGLDGFGVEAIQSLDSSRAYAELISMDEDTAERMLANEEIAGYIYISDTFVDNLKDSTNEPLIFKTKNIPAALSTLLTRELVTIISNYIVNSQSSILSLDEVCDEYDLDVDMNSANLRFIHKVMDRENIYEREEIGIGKGLTFSNYFIFSFIIILLMLWGISGSALLIKKDMSLSRLLKSCGHSSPAQVMGDYLPFLAMMSINLIILTLGLSFVSLPESFEVLSGAMDTPFVTALKLIPCAALISAMQFFIYELCRNTISAVLSQLLCVLALSYASGLIYPMNSLPAALQSFAKYLPTAIGFDYTVDILTGHFNAAVFAALFGFIVLFLLLSVIVREHKMRSNI